MRTSRRELLHIALATATAGLPLAGRTQTLDTAKILTGFAAGARWTRWRAASPPT